MLVSRIFKDYVNKLNPIIVEKLLVMKYEAIEKILARYLDANFSNMRPSEFLKEVEGDYFVDEKYFVSYYLREGSIVWELFVHRKNPICLVKTEVFDGTISLNVFDKFPIDALVPSGLISKIPTSAKEELFYKITGTKIFEAIPEDKQDE